MPCAVNVACVVIPGPLFTVQVVVAPAVTLVVLIEKPVVDPSCSNEAMSSQELTAEPFVDRPERIA